MFRNASEWLMRAIQVWRTDGFLTMVVRGSKQVEYWLFEWEEHYICEYVLGEMNEAEFIPRVENVSVRVIHTVGEAEELAIATGFNWLRRIKGSRRRLEKGGVAFCLSVNGEFAHVYWVALSDEAKSIVAAFPFKVDFPNNEACIGSAETQLKFRGKGLLTYSQYLQFQYLRDLGITVVRDSMEKNNIPTVKAMRRLGGKVYAEGHGLKLLTQRIYYKEIPIRSQVAEELGFECRDSNPSISGLIMRRLSSLFQQAMDIRNSNGSIQLLVRGFLFLTKPVFWYQVYILKVQNLEDSPKLNEADFRPKIDNVTLRIISTNQEADEVEAQGFEFRSCPTTWNLDLEVYRKRLDQGAIACCVFVGHELGAITWVILSKEAQEAIEPCGDFTQEVDYLNGEALEKGVWVNPKYRGMGLYKYNVHFNRDPFLLAKGITIIRTEFLQQDKTGQRFFASIGARPYAKMRLLRILWWKSWKRTPLSPDSQQD